MNCSYFHIEKPAEVVDEAARLVDEHRAVAGVGGVVARNLEELVQPRGAVDTVRSHLINLLDLST